jgi:hypothetical protein
MARDLLMHFTFQKYPCLFQPSESSLLKAREHQQQPELVLSPVTDVATARDAQQIHEREEDFAGKEDFGGTKISTVNPYTVVEKSIYNALTEAFIAEAAARNITRVASVAPFDVCFSSDNMFSTRRGVSVPTIYLVLQNKSVYWSIFGANSMVQVSEDVLCLGVVNGGEKPRTSIVQVFTFAVNGGEKPRSC